MLQTGPTRDPNVCVCASASHKKKKKMAVIDSETDRRIEGKGVHVYVRLSNTLRGSLSPPVRQTGKRSDPGLKLPKARQQ